jgi:hypothetical protein
MNNAYFDFFLALLLGLGPPVGILFDRFRLSTAGKETRLPSPMMLGPFDQFIFINSLISLPIASLP